MPRMQKENIQKLLVFELTQKDILQLHRANLHMQRDVRQKPRGLAHMRKGIILWLVELTHMLKDREKLKKIIPMQKAHLQSQTGPIHMLRVLSRRH